MSKRCISCTAISQPSLAYAEGIPEHGRAPVFAQMDGVARNLLALVLANAGAAQAQEVPGNKAGVVVDFGDGVVVTACVDLGTDGQATGEELLQAASFDVLIEYSSQGGAVCKINAQGCNYPDQQCWCQCMSSPCVYWAYHHLAGNQWQYATQGASTYIVHSGEVDGWAWGAGTVAQGAQPPLYTFDQICAPPTATPSPTTEPRPDRDLGAHAHPDADRSSHDLGALAHVYAYADPDERGWGDARLPTPPQHRQVPPARSQRQRRLKPSHRPPRRPPLPVLRRPLTREPVQPQGSLSPRRRRQGDPRQPCSLPARRPQLLPVENASRRSICPSSSVAPAKTRQAADGPARIALETTPAAAVVITTTLAPTATVAAASSIPPAAGGAAGPAAHLARGRARGNLLGCQPAAERAVLGGDRGHAAHPGCARPGVARVAHTRAGSSSGRAACGSPRRLALRGHGVSARELSSGRCPDLSRAYARRPRVNPRQPTPVRGHRSAQRIPVYFPWPFTG